MPYTISLPDFNAIVVHAGLVPERPLEQQSFDDMTLMRNIAVTRGPHGETEYTAFEHGKDGQPCASAWPGPQHVYFGHDAKRGLQLARYATGLDTGACYGILTLTDIIIENECIIMVCVLLQVAD